MLSKNLHSHNRGFSTGFHCTACEHTFRRELRRVYVDGTTFEKRVVHKQTTRHSEYIIPQRIVCPKCGALDQYELTPYTLISLSMTMTAALLAGDLFEGHPVKIITFALADGQIIHPLDALELYRQQLATAPQDQRIRMRYANTLRTLGYFDEAGAEYTWLVGHNPNLLEAWYNLAAIHVALKRKREAKKSLQCLVVQAQQASALSRAESNWAYNAQLYLDGVLPLDKLTPHELFDPAKPSSFRSTRHK